MTASSRVNSQTDSNRIDDTRGNITIEGSDSLVNERNIDQQTHTRQRLSEKKSALNQRCLALTFF